MKSVAFDQATISAFDAALIATDHSNIDYATLVSWSKLIVDTRNATRNLGPGGARIVTA
jgi:UDP-N-acetyl-D-glucosamine dehydrogenase